MYDKSKNGRSMWSLFPSFGNILLLQCNLWTCVSYARTVKIYRPNVKIIIILTQQQRPTLQHRKGNNVAATGYCYKIYIKYSKVHKFSRCMCVCDLCRSVSIVFLVMSGQWYYIYKCVNGCCVIRCATVFFLWAFYFSWFD